MQRKIKNGLIVMIGILIGSALLILVSPILILLYIYTSIYDIALDKKYKAYLHTIDKTRFFCYNAKTNYNGFIKNNIIPFLPKDIQLIYLNGRTPLSGFEEKCISMALHKIKDRKGFPYLLKISNGQLIDKSINNAFYNTMRQGKSVEQLIDNINRFYNE